MMECPDGVSIHAPARGATILIPVSVPVRDSFNPRARTGRDLTLDHVLNNGSKVSIHAPARGATNELIQIRSIRSSFNPRARTGRDRSGRPTSSGVSMFQSTRPHGARHTPPELPPEGSDVSIHAPARGATPRLESAPAIGFCFNPRARTGRDTIAELNKRGWDVSIHAPARGATNLFSTIAAIT